LLKSAKEQGNKFHLIDYWTKPDSGISDELKKVTNPSRMTIEELESLGVIAFRGMPRVWEKYPDYHTPHLQFTPEVLKKIVKSFFMIEGVAYLSGLAEKTTDKRRGMPTFMVTCVCCGRGLQTEMFLEPGDTKVLDYLSVEEYNEHWAFMSDKMVEFLLREPSLHVHLRSGGHVKKFMKLHHFISITGWPGPSMGARHAAPEL